MIQTDPNAPRVIVFALAVCVGFILCIGCCAWVAAQLHWLTIGQSETWVDWSLFGGAAALILILRGYQRRRDGHWRR